MAAISLKEQAKPFQMGSRIKSRVNLPSKNAGHFGKTGLTSVPTSRVSAHDISRDRLPVLQDSFFATAHSS